MSDYSANKNYESDYPSLYSSGVSYSKKRKVACTCFGQGCRNTCR